MKDKNFLLLQGPVGYFFKDLGIALQKLGANVHHVNFSGGDEMFCKVENAVNFTGPQSLWPEYLEKLVSKYNITDILMYGDCRYVHKVAIKLADRLGIEKYIFEEGYLRPYWVTVERKGVNAFSDLPRDRAFYESLENFEQPNFIEFKRSFIAMSLYSIAYYFGYVAKHKGLFKEYKHHSNIDYDTIAWQWTRRVLMLPFRRIEAFFKRLRLNGKSYFLSTLQLDRDSQIIVHSEFNDNYEYACKVMDSFKLYSDKNDYLVFKNHPLDSGGRRAKHNITKYAKSIGIEDRMVFIDAGKLPPLLSNAKGVIIVNSTAGLSALSNRRKTITLGRAVYSIDGLTYQGSLDDFWQEAKEKGAVPDPELLEKYKGFLLNSRQLNGGFYCKKSREVLVYNFINFYRSQIVKNQNDSENESANLGKEDNVVYLKRAI